MSPNNISIEDEIKKEKVCTEYHLPLTKINVTGKLTTQYDVRKDKTHKFITRDIKLIHQSDPDFHYKINHRNGILEEVTSSFSFTNDGRLISTKFTSEGKIVDIVKNSIHFLSSAAGIFIHTAAKRMAMGGDSKKITNLPEEIEEVYNSIIGNLSKTIPVDPAQEKYEKQFPNYGARREELMEEIFDISKSLIAKQREITDEIDPSKRYDLVGHSKDINDVLIKLRSEAAIIETHFNTWKSQVEKKFEMEKDINIKISELPKTEDIEKLIGKQIPDPELSKDCSEIFKYLELIISKKDLTTKTSRKKPIVGKKYKAIFFRLPRPIELSIWTLFNGKLILEKKGIYFIRDEKSQIGYSLMDKTILDKKTANLTFDDTGALTELSNFDSSDLEKLSEMMKEIPGEISSSLEGVNKLIDQKQTLNIQNISHQLESLKLKKEYLEQDIQYGGLLNTKQQQLEINEINQQLALLTAKMNLDSANTNLEIQYGTQELAFKKGLLDLEVQLERLQSERLRLEAEIKGLKNP